MSNEPTDASSIIEAVLEKYADDLIDLRRDLHAHPELSWSEKRTTGRRRPARPRPGLDVRLTNGTGLIADLGDRGPVVALRADLDALPVDDTTGEAWASRTSRRRPRLRPRRAHRRAGRCRARARRGARPRPAARPGPLPVPARRGGHARRSAAADGGGRPRRGAPDLHAALRPDRRRRPARAARGTAHRRGRRPRRPADGPRRPHLSPAPDRGPHLRPRQGDHRAARDPVPAARPARRRQRGVGLGPCRLARTT